MQHQDYRREWYLKNKTKYAARYQARKPEIAARKRQRLYGIDAAEFERRREAQDNACAICREPFSKSPHVDHCHLTQKVRGLLCSNCNRALGLFKDSAEVITSAITYLKEHSK